MVSLESRPSLTRTLRMTTHARKLGRHEEERFSTAALETVLVETGGNLSLVTAVLDAYRDDEVVSDPAAGLREARRHVSEQIVPLLSRAARAAAETMTSVGPLSEEEIDWLGGDLAQGVDELHSLDLALVETTDGLACHRLFGLIEDQWLQR